MNRSQRRLPVTMAGRQGKRPSALLMISRPLTSEPRPRRRPTTAAVTSQAANAVTPPAMAAMSVYLAMVAARLE